MSVDPITVEVIRNAATAISEEMNANLVRTGYSPKIKERRDCSCTIFDARGDMISQAENMPVHLGAMPFSVEAALKRYPPETLSPGDGILLNDPFHGGAHLPDLALITPVYHENELMAFAAEPFPPRRYRWSNDRKRRGEFNRDISGKSLNPACKNT